MRNKRYYVLVTVGSILCPAGESFIIFLCHYIFLTSFFKGSIVFHSMTVPEYIKQSPTFGSLSDL